MNQKILSSDELTAFLASWKKQFPETYLAPILWSFVGLRLKESRELLWRDVVTDRQPAMELHVRKEHNHQARARTLPLPNAVRVEIQHHIARCDYVDDIPDPAHTHLIPGTRSTPISERTLEWQAEQIGKRACARKVTPHMLRHTFATRLLAASNLRVTQDALGHRSVKSTERYTHPTFHDMAKAMAAASREHEPANPATPSQPEPLSP